MRIQVWHAASSKQAPGRIEQLCENYLDAEEVKRANRFRQPTSRNQHVIGRGMTRHLIGRAAGIDPRKITFGAGDHGKPFVRSPRQAVTAFNVAHTNGLVMCGLVACGLASNRPADGPVIRLGVDVESLDRRTDPAIADRFFAQPEVQMLHRCKDAVDRQLTFLTIWTLKEAFIKAIGTGMSTPLADFAFENIHSDQPTIRMLDPKLDTGGRWHFSTRRPRDGFIAATALCTGPSSPRPDVQWKRFDDVA